MKKESKQKVFVAMSGGVDSSVAAALLKKQGYDVCGIHIKMWSPHQSLRDGTGQADPVCRQQYQDRIDAMKVAAVLDIPFQTWDLTKEYKKEVANYMIREFAAGRTPNPDVMCNRHIKFGAFLKRALKAGADFVATGHYVRTQSSKLKTQNHNAKFKTIKLLQAKDQNKDQSYFLWTLTQDQLKYCLFPIGDYTKPEVRKLAKKFKLPNAEKKDSQGICFIGEIDLRKFLQKYIKSKPGKIVTASGKIIGKHDGLAFYTIGQRHGLNVGGGIPFYVAKKDFKKNLLVVGEGPYDEKLFSQKLTVKKVNWISGKTPAFPLKCEARIRYRQPLQKCLVLQTANCKLQTVFYSHQRAITPGQSIVFYKGGEILGGGIIN